MNEVQELMTGMSDEDLLEAVEEKYANYTREALEVAQQELRRRQIPFADQSAFYPPEGEEEPFEEESTEDKSLQTQQNIAKADKTISNIWGSLLVVGSLIYISLLLTPPEGFKILALILVFMGGAALVLKNVKRDVFNDILFFTLLILLLTITAYFFLHRKPNSLGSIPVSLYAASRLIPWYRADKRLALWKLIALIVFLAVYIVVDFSFFYYI